MADWSPSRPRRGDRCKYTLKVLETHRAKYPEHIDRRGIVRQFSADTGITLVRWDDRPGELDKVWTWDLVREDHDGRDPMIEIHVHATDIRVLTDEDLF